MAEMIENKEVWEPDSYRVIIDSIDGREHELLTDQDIFDKDTIMYPAYQAALRALKGIIESTERWNGLEGERKEHCHKDYSIDSNMYGFANNVLAFCGSRGQGKTSAMMSFASALGNQNNHIRRGAMEQKKLLRPWTGGKEFYILPPIDPTMLGDGTSVSDLILAKLFTELYKAWEDSSGQRFGRACSDEIAGESEKYRILKLLQQCRDGIRNKDDKNSARRNGDFEQFVQSVDVFSFKKDLHVIIQHLLKIYNYNRDDFVVIQLDDTDMQLDRAHETMEVVRRYLSIPNVVVLMATDLVQLRNLTNVHYRKAIDDPRKEVSFRYDYMAAKYIDKLLPVSHAIQLPTMTSSYGLGKKIVFRVDNHNEKSQDTLESYLFKKIYNKTGLVFISHRRRLHELLPSSLRGLQHLSRLLSRMEDLDVNVPAADPNHNRLERVRRQIQNLSLFEDYLVNDWFVSKVQAVYKVQTDNSTSNNNRVNILAEVETVPTEDLLSFFSKWVSDNALRSHDMDSPQKAKSLDSSDDTKYEELIQKLFDIAGSCRTSEDYNLYFFVGAYLSIRLHKYALADEIRSLEEFELTIKDTSPEEIENKDKINTIKYRILSSAVHLQTDGSINNADALFRELGTSCDQKAIIKVFVYFICFFDNVADTTAQIRVNPEEKILNYQEILVSVLFNWDVLRQIMKNLDSSWKSDKGYLEIIPKFFNKLEGTLEGKCPVIGSFGISNIGSTTVRLAGKTGAQNDTVSQNTQVSRSKLSDEFLLSLVSLEGEVRDVLEQRYLNRRLETRQEKYQKLLDRIKEASLPENISKRLCEGLEKIIENLKERRAKAGSEDRRTKAERKNAERNEIELLKKEFDQYFESVTSPRPSDQ